MILRKFTQLSKRILVLLLLFSFGFLISCSTYTFEINNEKPISQSNEESESVPFKDENRIDEDLSDQKNSFQQLPGNSNGNLRNGGFVVRQGDWIFYINQNDGDKIYKKHYDGTQNQKLNDDESSHLNILNDWIYYEHSSGYIYKIRTDGTENQQLSEFWSDDFVVDGDWVYYHNLNKGSLDKVNIDGTQNQQLSRYFPVDINVVGNWIYFVGFQTNYLYKIQTNGSNLIGPIIGKDQNLNNVQIENGWIYYDSGLGIYRSKLDGSNNQMIVDEVSVRDINVSNGWIYYTTYNSDSHISKIRTNGEDYQELNNESSYFINVVGDWIYYYIGNYDSLIRIRIDGTDRQLFE